MFRNLIKYCMYAQLGFAGIALPSCTKVSDTSSAQGFLGKNKKPAAVSGPSAPVRVKTCADRLAESSTAVRMLSTHLKGQIVPSKFLDVNGNFDFEAIESIFKEKFLDGKSMYAPGVKVRGGDLLILLENLHWGPRVPVNLGDIMDSWTRKILKGLTPKSSDDDLAWANMLLKQNSVKKVEYSKDDVVLFMEIYDNSNDSLKELDLKPSTMGIDISERIQHETWDKIVTDPKYLNSPLIVDLHPNRANIGMVYEFRSHTYDIVHVLQMPQSIHLRRVTLLHVSHGPDLTNYGWKANGRSPEGFHYYTKIP